MWAILVKKFQDKATTRTLTTTQLQFTAEWYQNEPYNQLCPIVNGQVICSGYVATTAAIVMHYHKCPKRGNGKIPGYSYTNETS